MSESRKRLNEKRALMLKNNVGGLELWKKKIGKKAKVGD
jgi:hypothetical protein